MSGKGYFFHILFLIVGIVVMIGTGIVLLFEYGVITL
jgi:hypothetical protein